MGDLVGIDLAVGVGVERLEESLGIGGHFVGGDRSVMIGVGLSEPGGQAFGARRAGEERLAHRTHEGTPALRRLNCRGRGGEHQGKWHGHPFERQRGNIVK